MKQPTLQKISCLALALVAALAVSANAGPALSTARLTHGSTKAQSFVKLLFPNATYMLDDGTAEDGIGLTAGGDIISLNEFAVTAGAETITSVEIAWGTPAFPDPSLNGLPYTVAVWSDPNGDGNPSDAQLLTTASGVIANQGTNTFITTDVTPTTITTANFFVGFLLTQNAGQFPSAFDQTDPTLANRSYIAGGSTGTGDINNLNNNELPVAPIESFGLVGNWLIRANAGGGGGGDIVLEADVRRQQGNRFVDLHWTPSDGGDIDILRNGVVIGTTEDDGAFRNRLGTDTGSFTYQVCEPDTGNCSNEVRVRVRPRE